MLVTDNDYPRFYGYANDVDHGPLYMVAHPGAYPVFKYSDERPPAFITFSAVHADEESLLAVSERNSHRQLVMPSKPIAEAMLTYYTSRRKDLAC